MRNNNNRSRPTIAIWTPTRPLLIWNPVRNHQALKTWWKPVEWMKKGARCLLGNLYICSTVSLSVSPRFSQNLHCPIWNFCQSVTIEHISIWKLEVGICQCHHWTYVDLEVGSVTIEHVTLIFYIYTCRYPFVCALKCICEKRVINIKITKYIC